MAAEKTKQTSNKLNINYLKLENLPVFPPLDQVRCQKQNLTDGLVHKNVVVFFLFSKLVNLFILANVFFPPQRVKLTVKCKLTVFCLSHPCVCLSWFYAVEWVSTLISCCGEVSLAKKKN